VSILPIVLWPDPRLSENCAAILQVSDEHRALAQDMLDTMYAANGRGLAGPQVGVMERIFVMDAAWKSGEPEPRVFINPTVMARDPAVASMIEGCLSIPGLEITVERPAAVTLQWTSETGEIHMDDFDGFEARCIQHEIDHLNGTVALDHLSADDRADLLQGYNP